MNVQKKSPSRVASFSVPPLKMGNLDQICGDEYESGDGECGLKDKNEIIKQRKCN